MAQRQRVRLNRREIRRQLQSPEFRAVTTEAAEKLAQRAGGRRKGVFVDEYTTDRQAAAVKLPAIRQTRNGALTRAAAAVGLEVRVR